MTKAKQPEGEARGFTIIELLIAISVLSVGLLSIVAMSAYVARSNIDSNTISVLATEVQSEVDALRSASWTVSACDPQLNVGGSLTSDLTSHYATANTSTGSVVIRWQVAQGATADYRYVTVNAVRAGYPGDVKNGITVTTIINRK